MKSYLNRTPKYLPEAEIRVFDFFPKNHLEVLDRIGGIAMLHIPRNGRLKDPVNLAQIEELKHEFPNVRLIIAHIGRAYTRGDVGNAFETLDKLPDLMYDFSANCCEYSITEVIRHAGPKHVMFGTDMPILRMRTHRIEENGTYINLVPPGLYGDPSADPHLREVSAEEAKKITFFAYEDSGLQAREQDTESDETGYRGYHVQQRGQHDRWREKVYLRGIKEKVL